ncbi:hypothetical protein PR048_020576 [Dryococelus australis]|uniref:Uncharacterized protein n=1 Tax=Dryococelus australis TaxID=614101 RepID=A0ABQ9H6U0_9NEOP|nr:hypothetical protein PR048_020576 [Dryococelus australis]
MQGQGETGDLGENPSTSGIVRHDSYVRKSGSDPVWNRTRVRFLAGSCPDLRVWESRRTISSEIIRFPLPLHPGAAPYSPRFTLIGSEDLNIKSLRRSAGIKVHGKREIPEKIHRPAASSCAFPTCEIPGVTRPGIERSSSWWEASRLTAQPSRPHRRRGVLKLYSSCRTTNILAVILDS